MKRDSSFTFFTYSSDNKNRFISTNSEKFGSRPRLITQYRFFLLNGRKKNGGPNTPNSPNSNLRHTNSRKFKRGDLEMR